MIIKKSVARKVEVIDDVICDGCGKSCKVFGDENFAFMTLHTKWGYGSKYDVEEWTAHVCEECVDTKLDFIKFEKHEYTVFS